MTAKIQFTFSGRVKDEEVKLSVQVEHWHHRLPQKGDFVYIPEEIRHIEVNDEEVEQFDLDKLDGWVGLVTGVTLFVDGPDSDGNEAWVVCSIVPEYRCYTP